MPTYPQRVFGSRPAVAVTSVIVTAVVLMGGIALANVPNGSVTSKKIRNSTIKSIDIRNGQVKSIDIRNGTVTGTDIRNGTVTATDLHTTVTPMWAKVDADSNGATLIRGRGVNGVSRWGLGIFLVTFVRNITGCGWIATLNDNSVFEARNGQIAIEQASNALPDSLWVRTFNEFGDLEDPQPSDGFTVQVVC